MKKIGIYYHPQLPRAKVLSLELSEALESLATPYWVCSSWEEKEACNLMPGTGLLVTLGGDGTTLRAARAALSEGTPILGARLGRVGFLSEVEPEQLIDKVRAFLQGEGWQEERMMLAATVASTSQEHDALNDVVVGRGDQPRSVHIQVSIDGQYFTTYTADGVIVATPTGSTGYSLAAGGPLLHPSVQGMVLTPVAAHLCLGHPLVLPASVSLELQVLTDGPASLTVDGRMDSALQNGDTVRVRRSQKVTRFLRFDPSTHYYSVLSQRLRGKE